MPHKTRNIKQGQIILDNDYYGGWMLEYNLLNSASCFYSLVYLVEGVFLSLSFCLRYHYERVRSHSYYISFSTTVALWKDLDIWRHVAARDMFSLTTRFLKYKFIYKQKIINPFPNPPFPFFLPPFSPLPFPLHLPFCPLSLLLSIIPPPPNPKTLPTLSPESTGACFFLFGPDSQVTDEFSGVEF